MRLPRALRQELGALWILLMVLIAGGLNAAGWLEFGQTLSHMTGNLTKLGFALGGQEESGLLIFLAAILSFFLGATLSGYGFPRHGLAPWRRSGIVLMLCGGALFVMEGLAAPEGFRLAALALVLGAQNGLALRYRGILTRTTHMTGHLTDCGAALGRMIHSRTFRGEDLRLFLFHLSCLCTFALGVLLIALYAPGVQQGIALAPIALCALCQLATGALTYAYGLHGRPHDAA